MMIKEQIKKIEKIRKNYKPRGQRDVFPLGLGRSSKRET